jgi:hypothetical protein
MRVQGLQKSRSTDPAQWDETKDKILGEYRGSAMIERFIDSGDPDLPDFATNTGGNATRFPDPQARFDINSYYKFRVLSTKKFP